MRVEVHDRDVILPGSDDEAGFGRFEALVGAPMPPPPPAPAAAAARVPEGLADATLAEGFAEAAAGENGGGDAAAATPPPPRHYTAFDVDRLYLEALAASWERAGDDHAHGEAAARLDGLLSQAQQLVAAFARNNLAPSPRLPFPLGAKLWRMCSILRGRSLSLDRRRATTAISSARSTCATRRRACTPSRSRGATRPSASSSSASSSTRSTSRSAATA